MSRYKKIIGTKSVYTPSLIPNISYLINIWHRKTKNPDPIVGEFMGYGKDSNNLSDKIPKLNTITDGNLYFKIQDGIIHFPINNKIPYYYDNGIRKRVTFSFDTAQKTNNVFLNKEELKFKKLIDKASNTENRDFKHFSKLSLSINSNNNFLYDYYKNLLSKYDDKFLDDIFNLFINDDKLNIVNRNNNFHSKTYFSYRKYFEYKDIYDFYSNIRNAKRYNLSKYLSIEYNKLKFIMNNMSSKTYIEDFIKTIDIDNIKIYSNDVLIDIEDSIKEIILWLFCLYSNEQVNSLIDFYKLYSIIELSI